MRMYGRLGLHAESVVLPLLAADAPVVTWWHGAPPEQIAHDPLGVFADRRITDARSADGPAGRAAAARRGLRARRHRPRLDPQHPVAGDARLHAGLGVRAPRRAGARAGRPGRGRPEQRDRPAARRLAVLALRLPDRGGGRHPHPRAERRRRRRAAAGPGRGGPAAGRPPRRRRHRPAVPPGRPPWRCPTGPSATCSARSCAGWTPTSPTARRWRRSPAPRAVDRSPAASTSGSTRCARQRAEATATEPTRPTGAAPACTGMPGDTDEVALAVSVDDARRQPRQRRPGRGRRPDEPCRPASGSPRSWPRRAPDAGRRDRAGRRPAGPVGRLGAGRPAGRRAGRARDGVGGAHRRRASAPRVLRAGRRAGRRARARGRRLDRGRRLVGRRALRAGRRRRAQREAAPGAALLDRGRRPDPSRIHADAAVRRAAFAEPEEAAAWYAEQLAAARRTRPDRPRGSTC